MQRHPGLEVLEEESVPVVTEQAAPVFEAPPPDEGPAEGCGVDLDGATCHGTTAGHACAICGGGSCQPPRWYLEQGVRLLVRNRPDQLIATTFIPVTVQQQTIFSGVMNNRDFDFDTAAGYTITLGRHLGRDTENRDHFIESTYWGFNTWRESNQFTATARLQQEISVGRIIEFGNLFSGFPAEVGGFNRADVHNIFYDSDIHNFEFGARISPRGRPDRLVLYPNGKWRRECQPGCYLSYLFGFRHVSITEKFLFSAQGEILDNDVPGTVSGQYHVRTDNELIGFQIGADVTWRSCKWSFGVQGKVGPYVNFADQISDIRTDADVDPFATTPLNLHFADREDALSMVGEVSFVGQYRLRPNLTLRASYDLMWVAGLALAPEQLQQLADPPVLINTQGSIFYQGLNLTAELAF